MTRSIAILLSLFLFAPHALAHDPALHKGSKTAGTIKSIRVNEVQLQTDQGIILVHLAATTKYEFAHDGSMAVRDALKEGQSVAIFGHKLENGALGASVVLIEKDLKTPHPPDDDHGE